LKKAMACCNPLREVAATNVAEAENVGEAGNMVEVVPTVDGDEMLVVLGNEGRASNKGGTDDSADERASDNGKSWLNNFGASTITMGRIKEMMEKG
jgi:hypothetical protein